MFENITTRHFADPGDLRDAPEPDAATALMAALAAFEDATAANKAAKAEIDWTIPATAQPEAWAAYQATTATRVAAFEAMYEIEKAGR